MNNYLDEAHILLMSRLDCGGNEMSNYHDPTKRHSSTSLKRELLIDYITAGYIQNNAESQSMSRIIVSGGRCAKPIPPERAINN